MKTGFHPMKIKLKLFFKWGIELNKDKPYAVEDNGDREVVYAEKKEIMDGIVQKYHPEWLIKEELPTDSESTSGVNQAESQSHEPHQTSPNKPKNKKQQRRYCIAICPSEFIATVQKTHLPPREYYTHSVAGGTCHGDR